MAEFAKLILLVEKLRYFSEMSRLWDAPDYPTYPHVPLQ
jgi:hypothetical protein